MAATTAFANPTEAVYREHAATCDYCLSHMHHCVEGSELRGAYLTSSASVAAAPIQTVNRYGRVKGHWDIASALTEVAANGGEITEAPAGAVEEYERQEAEAAAARRERAAARRKAGLARPPRFR